MLSEIGIRTAKPREMPYKLSDERGLSLGVYPDVTPAMARKRRDEAHGQLADGVDPSHKRKAEKLSNANTFRAIAEEWPALQNHGAEFVGRTSKNGDPPRS